jgi:hypothetical protein
MWMTSSIPTIPKEEWSREVETDYITTENPHSMARPGFSSMSPPAAPEIYDAQGKANAVEEAEKANELILKNNEEFLDTGLFYRASEN